MNEMYDDGQGSLPDGYAIVAYPGFSIIDAILGEMREIVPFCGPCRVGDFYRSPNSPIGEVRVVTMNFEEAVEMLNASKQIGVSSLLKYVGRLISGS